MKLHAKKHLITCNNITSTLCTYFNFLHCRGLIDEFSANQRVVGVIKKIGCPKRGKTICLKAQIRFSTDQIRRHKKSELSIFEKEINNN